MSLNPVNYSRFAVLKSADKVQVRAEKNRNHLPTHDSLNNMVKKLRRATEAAVQYRDDSARVRELTAEAYQEVLKHQNTIKFEYNRNGNHELVVKVVNRLSGELVWQFPPAQALALQKLAKYMPGIFLNYKG